MAPERDPLARGFPRAPEPFGTTANPGSYVAREATESALDALTAAVRAAEPVVLFGGPPGIGKTLLLHVLAQRLEGELRAVFLPYAALTPEELCAVVLDRLGAPRTENSSGMLKAYARHLAGEGSALLLLIDDAGAVPEESLRWCCEAARGANGAIRCVFALTDDLQSPEVAAALGAGAIRVRLDTPMTPAETADYVQVQLAVGRVSGSVQALFDERVVDDLQRASRGVPRSLHTAAHALLRRQPGSHAEVEAAAPPPGDPEPASDATPEVAAPPEPAPGADTPMAPAIREEIERLRRDAGRPQAPVPATSRRGIWMAAAFGAAVVLGLAIATLYRPFSTWVVRGASPPGVPEAPPPTSPVRAVQAPPPEARVAQPPPPELPLRQPEASEAPAADAELALEAAPADETAPARGPDPGAPAEPVAPLRSAAAAPPGAPRPAAAEAAGVDGAPEPLAAPAVAVSINATPWATIEVDGEPLGETPLAGVSLSAGPHRFRAQLPDGRVIEREIVVDPDDPFIVFDEPAAP